MCAEVMIVSTHRITLELPDDSYALLRRLVESGGYASESRVVADALLDLRFGPSPSRGDPSFDRWLREEVLAADDELKADPSSGLTPEQLHASLQEARTLSAKRR
jgi:Arc/MetJ-type ribon-helix-helix transcriptional regulator